MERGESSVERFGELLVRVGAIGEDEVATVLEKQKAEPSKRFGEIAVELGYLSSKQVDEFLGSGTAH